MVVDTFKKGLNVVKLIRSDPVLRGGKKKFGYAARWEKDTFLDICYDSDNNGPVQFYFTHLDISYDLTWINEPS